MSENIKVGITIGDINGVGLEVCLKTLSSSMILNHITPVIYGSGKVVSYHKNILPETEFQFQNLRNAQRLNSSKINIVNCWQDNININLGTPDASIAKYSITSLDQAVRDHMEGYIDCIVTAPIDKHNMAEAGFKYPGHTEYFGDRYDSTPLMIMVQDGLRVATVTSHIPLGDVAGLVTKDTISAKLMQFNTSLRRDFGIEKPVIAVLGLNPHAGDRGTLGTTEDEHIRPAIIEAKKNGHIVMGPFAADGFFASGNYKKFDGVLSMYHDQGLIPFKILTEGNGINFTSGLPLVRTSPDHGTAFDIAGQGVADHHSFLNSVFAAKDIMANRKMYDEGEQNKLVKTPKPSEEEL
jgi:4-hydroxythreonine-4-phosphate dehydrogenase